MLSVIPRLDRGIQCFQGLLDYPVKPGNDKIRLYTQTLFSHSLSIGLGRHFLPAVHPSDAEIIASYFGM